MHEHTFTNFGTLYSRGDITYRRLTCDCGESKEQEEDQLKPIAQQGREVSAYKPKSKF